MRTITFNQPRRLVFGCGSIAACISYIQDLSPGDLRIICSPFVTHAVAEFERALVGSRTRVSTDSSIAAEPTIEDCLAAIESAQAAGTTCVLGIGGGSVLDVAKLVAALVNGEQRLTDTFGTGLLQSRSCHLICMPTTSGTGSEVSPNSILLDEGARMKKAVISPHLMPDAAFIDPDLTVTVPAPVTAATGLDALAHCLEAYTNKFAHPMVDIYALEGVALAGRFLLRAVQDPKDMEAREGMALSSVYGGLCLGPVNTAAGHALAYPLGSEYRICHGVSVALVQPHVFRFNAEASPDRHASIARALGVEERGTDSSVVDAGAKRLEALTRESGIHLNPAKHGVRTNDIGRLADSALKVERLLRNSPRAVTRDDCIAIYQRCFQYA